MYVCTTSTDHINVYHTPVMNENLFIFDVYFQHMIRLSHVSFLCKQKRERDREKQGGGGVNAKGLIKSVGRILNKSNGTNYTKCT